MVDLVRTVHAAGHDLHAISAGGGLSIPYREGEERINPTHYFACGTLPANTPKPSSATPWAWSWSRGAGR